MKSNLNRLMEKEHIKRVGHSFVYICSTQDSLSTLGTFTVSMYAERIVEVFNYCGSLYYALLMGCYIYY